MPYVHNLEIARRILRIQPKTGNGHLGKTAIDALDSSMKKRAADLMANE